jgi:Flp pilus assembly protein TadG
MMKERGQSLVEFAISLLILLFLLAGAAEFGVLFFQFVQLRDAAQEGALYGSMNPSSYSGIEVRARAASDKPVNLNDPSQVHVSVFVDNTLVWKDGASQGTTSVACEGHGVRVTVEYDHQIFMPFLPQILNDSKIPLAATVVDTILTPVCSP